MKPRPLLWFTCQNQYGKTRLVQASSARQAAIKAFRGFSSNPHVTKMYYDLPSGEAQQTGYVVNNEWIIVLRSIPAFAEMVQL